MVNVTQAQVGRQPEAAGDNKARNKETKAGAPAISINYPPAHHSKR